MSERDPTLELLKRFSQVLPETLREQFTLVGGTAPSVYSKIDRVGLRSTIDIDVSVRATEYGDWLKSCRMLEDSGFRSTPEGPICRYTSDSFVVDVIPSSPAILGFKQSDWYHHVHQHRTFHPEVGLYVVDPVLFLALKAEAHSDRGLSQLHPMSKDLEDVLVVLGNDSSTLDRVVSGGSSAAQYVLRFLRDTFGAAGMSIFQLYFPGDGSTQKYAEGLFERLREAWSREESDAKTSGNDV